MGLGLSDYVAITSAETREDAGENWFEMLRQWLVKCPHCSEVRLVVGAQEKDRYICKNCGKSFVIDSQLRQ
jgi:DNA-directed RNA polymerase subunit RPC12/RpoP